MTRNPEEIMIESLKTFQTLTKEVSSKLDRILSLQKAEGAHLTESLLVTATIEQNLNHSLQILTQQSENLSTIQVVLENSSNDVSLNQTLTEILKRLNDNATSGNLSESLQKLKYQSEALEQIQLKQENDSKKIFQIHENLPQKMTKFSKIVGIPGALMFILLLMIGAFSSIFQLKLMIQG